MFIRKVKPRTFDVFLGLGWNNWARIHTNNYGDATTIKVINRNIPISSIDVEEIKTRFIKHHTT